MKQRLNPVLPPPRRPLNPVDALLTARSPQQVRLHFARWNRALLYEWERDDKYKGSKGGKWIGTGDDAGKSPRYQNSKPGTGRAGKKDDAAGKGKKADDAPAARGGKQKDAHADIVQHLRDVLSGEGEEADALFAKLQDRLASMSPAERKEAAEKLGAVLGGKKPAAKKESKALPEPKEKKQPGKQPTEQATFDATKEAFAKLNKESNVKIPELFDAVAEKVPGLTQEQFGKMLLQWKQDDLITLQVVGHRDAEPRSSEGVEGPKGMYFYVQLNDDPQHLKLPTGRDKPAPANKPAEKPVPAKRAAAAKKQGPKDGDTNAKGQVFRDGRWRKPEGEKATGGEPKKQAGSRYEGMDDDAVVADLSRYNISNQQKSGATQEQINNPWGLVGYPDGIDVPAITGSVVDAVRKAKSANAYSRPTIAQIFDSVRKAHPGVTLDQFQQALAQMHRDKTITLGAYTMAPSTIPKPALRAVIPLDAEIKNYVDIGTSATAGKSVPGSPVHEPPRLPEPPKKADKPTPGTPTQSSPEEVGHALKDSMDYLKLFVGMQDGLIPLNRVYHELVKRVPDLTKEQFHNLVWQLGQDRKAEFHVLNEVNTASSDAKDYAIGKNDRMYNYLRLKPEAVKSGKDLVPSKPAVADKEHKSWSEAYPD